MEWKTVSVNDRYEVSDTGLVRYKKNGHILAGKVKKKKKCRWVRLLNHRNNKVPYKVQYLVATAFVENDDPEHKTKVFSKDWNTLNEKAENLEWVTPQDYNHRYFRKQMDEVAERKRERNQPIPVRVYTYEPREFVGEFPSLKKSSLVTNMPVRQIRKKLKDNGDKPTRVGKYWYEPINK